MLQPKLKYIYYSKVWLLNLMEIPISLCANISTRVRDGLGKS